MDEKARIEKIMQMEGMNSAQFALETGIQTSTLSHILNGRNKVSLKVFQQILSRFSLISLDWLFLGAGPMYRQEKQSQSLTLFDSTDENISNSDVYIKTKAIKTGLEKDVNRKISEPLAEGSTFLPPIAEKPPRKIKRIIVYFDDNSFQEFIED